MDNVATGGMKIGEFGNVCKKNNLKRDQDEDKIVQVNHKSYRKTEWYTRYWQRLDVPAKELPWHRERKAREQELKYLRDLGVYEKVDEREAIAQYKVTPVDTKWIDTNKAVEVEPTNCCKRVRK